MGDQRSCAGQRVVPVASNTSTGPAIRRRVRASATNSSRSGFVVLHSSAPGAPRPLCTRSPRDLPVWVGANVPVGLVNGEHMAPVGPRCSGAPTSSSGARARSAAESPGRVHSAVRRAAVSDSSRRISRRVACPAGVGPHRRQPSPMTGVAAATLPASSTMATVQYTPGCPARVVHAGASSRPGSSALARIRTPVAIHPSAGGESCSGPPSSAAAIPAASTSSTLTAIITTPNAHTPPSMSRSRSAIGEMSFGLDCVTAYSP